MLLKSIEKRSRIVIRKWVNYVSILLIVHPAILHSYSSYYACIFQDKAYWEVKIQQDGIWSIGIATPSADLNKDLGLDSCSWALTHTGLVRTRGHQVGTGMFNLHQLFFFHAIDYLLPSIDKGNIDRQLLAFIL